jgi:hypothetical protein
VSISKKGFRIGPHIRDKEIHQNQPSVLDSTNFIFVAKKDDRSFIEITTREISLLRQTEQHFSINVIQVSLNIMKKRALRK